VRDVNITQLPEVKDMWVLVECGLGRIGRFYAQKSVVNELCIDESRSFEGWHGCYVSVKYPGDEVKGRLLLWSRRKELSMRLFLLRCSSPIRH
jgi:hypothetical protein